MGSWGKGRGGAGLLAPRALEESPVAGGGHSGRGPGVGFIGLATRLLLPHGFPSQVITGDHVAGRWGTEDFNTMAMNRGVDFLKNKVAHQCPSRPGGDWGGRGWRPQGSGHLRSCY